MVDRRPSAGEAGALNLNHFESVGSALKHLEAAIAKVAEGVYALPDRGNLFSPGTQRPGMSPSTDRLAEDHAALQERYAALNRQHSDLRQAHDALLKRQAEAFARLGAVMERLRRALPEMADEIGEDMADDGMGDGA